MSLINVKPRVISADVDELRVFKATYEDLEGIFNVASSVGNRKKDPNLGFLMDNYSADKSGFIKKLSDAVEESDFFYVIKKRNKVLGFLLGYDKNQWLNQEPRWIFDTHWRTDFNKSALNKFVILEKIAVKSDVTGLGIGSIMFQKFKDDAKSKGISDMFSETIISPKPNFASMQFAIKQNYNLAGIRYEKHEGKVITDIIYHKKFNK